MVGHRDVYRLSSPDAHHSRDIERAAVVSIVVFTPETLADQPFVPHRARVTAAEVPCAGATPVTAPARTGGCR